MNYKNSVRDHSRTLLNLGLVLGTSVLSHSAHANIGSLGFDSTSFFYKSDERGTSSTTFKASLEGKADQKLFHEQGDLTVYTFVNNSPELNAEAKQAYVSSQPGALGNSEVTVGRRIYEWSKVDETWFMMSLWTPRFTWDPLYPETIGLTGAFYTYNDSNFHFMAYGSPISIPERGTPIQEKEGTITSPNPFWKPLPKTQMVMGVPTNMNYRLLMPDMQDILLRPNAAIKAKYELDMGLWGSLSYGVLPVHSTPLAAKPYVPAGSTQAEVQVDIYPQLPMRNLMTAEAGFMAPDKDWDVWVSGSYEQPFNFKNDSNWLNPVITPATIFSSGTNIKLTKNFTFHGGVLFIHEGPFTHASNLPAVSVELPSRFPLKQGFQVGGDWRFTDYTKSRVQWTQDLVEQNHYVSLNIDHQFPKSAIQIGAGADVMFADSTKGWIGQYYGDDRFRGWLRYAF